MRFKKTIKTVAAATFCSALAITVGAAGASAEPIDLKIGHGHSAKHSFHLAMEKFAELLEQKAPGQFNARVFPSAQLGSERVMQEALTLGTLEITVTGVLGIYEPKFALLELPFLFRDRPHILAAQQSDAVKALAASLPPKGLRLIGFVENGFRNITNNVLPINTPADLDGLKIRTPENPAQIETFKALGAKPTPMPFSELYNALKQGVVDGQENPLQNIYDGKLYEVQKHIALSGHIYNSAYIVISESFFQGLTKAQQAALSAAALEAGQWQFNYIKELDGELLGKLKAAGMQVTEVDKGAFLKATAPAYEVFYGKFGADARKFVSAIQGIK